MASPGVEMEGWAATCYNTPVWLEVEPVKEEQSPYRTLSSKRIYENPWYWLQHDEVAFPDGSLGTYTIVRRGKASFVVPVLDSGDVILIRHYRYTVDRFLWEIPAGGVESGMTPFETAEKELAEEIGGTARSYQHVGAFYSLPGISDELSEVFIASGVTLGVPRRESSEVIEIHHFSPVQISGMLSRGEVLDGPSALALYMAMPLLRSRV